MFQVVGKAVLSGKNTKGEDFSYNKVYLITDKPTSNYNITRFEGQAVTSMDATSEFFANVAIGQVFTQYYFDRNGHLAMVAE